MFGELQNHCLNDERLKIKKTADGIQDEAESDQSNMILE